MDTMSNKSEISYFIRKFEMTFTKNVGVYKNTIYSSIILSRHGASREYLYVQLYANPSLN